MSAPVQGWLPPLPKPFGTIDVYKDDGEVRGVDGFTADQMRGYALEQHVIASQSAAPVAASDSIEAPTSEPVKYEQRMRAPNGNCGPWHETSTEMHVRYSANPDIGDGFSYERRALFAAPVIQEAHASQSASVEDAWSAEPPTEQAWYWHWNGDPDSSPFPLSVLYSGTARKCFVQMDHSHSGQAEFCDTYDGYWMRMREPAIAAMTKEPDTGTGKHGGEVAS